MKFNDIIAPYLKKYPNLFGAIEGARLSLIASGLTWHKACYIPMAAVSTVMGVNPQGKIEPLIDALMAVANVAAFASWRIGGKHIIKIDPTLEAELIRGGIKGNVPMHIFEWLPFMCAYIEMSNDPDIVGFFVHIEHDILTDSLELQFVMENTKGEIAPTVIDLKAKGTVEQVVEETMRNAPVLGQKRAKTVVTEISGLMRRVLPLVMYLCSVSDETKALQSPTTMPTLQRKNRVMATNQPRIWNIGERVGAMIRTSAEREATDPTGTGASKRPHIRRAHWHTYRVGSGRTETITKWIYQMTINADDGSDMPETTRKI